MEQEVQLLAKIESDNDWLQENYENIQKNHEKEFVAISEHEIIATGKNIDVVIKKVKNAGKNPAFVLIEFIPKKGITLII